MHMLTDPYIDWVKTNLKKPGKNQTGLGLALGIDQSAVSRIVNGRRKLSTSEVPKAEAYFEDVAPGGELRPSFAQTGPVVIAGKTAAGVFREVDDMDQSESEKIWEPLDERFPNARRMAFDVEGDSMNDLKPRPIFNGDRAICVSFEDVAAQVKVRDGLVVVVERTRDGGHTREWSLKQVELFDDRTEFHPRSTNPKHKPIVVMKDALADDGVQVEIIGLLRAIRNEFPI